MPAKPLQIQFGADSLKMSGPLRDGSYTVTFSTGEYEQLNIAKLLTIPQQVPLRITVEVEG